MADSFDDAPNGGWDDHFEETLAMKDGDRTRGLITVTRVSVVVMILYTFGSIVIVVGVAAVMFTSTVGGVDVALSIVEGIRTERPSVFVGSSPSG